MKFSKVVSTVNHQQITAMLKVNDDLESNIEIS